MNTDILITAYNDHEEGRLDRLRLVRRDIMAKDLPIIAIRDHKGTLYVNWQKTPFTAQVMEVMAIWRNNAEYLANHYVNGRELILDVLGDNPFN